MSKVIIVKKEYKGWKNCISMSNDFIELIATTDVGPRIISLSFHNDKNVFCEFEEFLGTTGGDEWKIYGGHRLWHSPESKPRTYEPDNSKISWRKKKNSIVLTQPVEPWTQIQKEMEIHLSPDSPRVTVTHRLTNKGAWTVELALWALSVMAPGGKEIIPQITKDTGLLPNRSLSLWPYTKMNDPRIYWGEKYIFVSQSQNADAPLKIGLPNEDGWAAYINGNNMFLLQYTHVDGVSYPDYGSSYETYTNDRMLEMETLTPLVLLDTNDTIEHTEVWTLYKDVPMVETEQDVEKYVVPLIKPALENGLSKK